MAAKPRFDGEWVRLGELTSCISKKNKDGRCATVCSVTNSQGFVLSTEFFTKEVFSKELRTYKLVERNQLAYNPSRINVGSIALQDIADEVVVSPLYIVFAVDASRIDSSYLLRYLKSRPGLKQVEFNSIGTVRNNLKYDGLCQISVPLPSLEVQRSRVRSLIALETEIKEGEETLSKLDVLVKSRFAEMFGDAGWPVATVGSLAVDVRYGTSKKASDCGEYVYLRMNNMTDDGRLDLDDVKRIDLNGPELEKCRVVDGDLLFNRTNSREKVGKTVVFHEREPMVIAGYIIRVRLGDRVRPDFLATYMNLPTTKAMLRSIAKGAVHQANINSRELSAIEVPVPPMELQDRFLSFAAEVDKSRFIVQQQIEKLQMLYDSLAQEYFS